jgi:3-oxo-5alpha-steroid 4-dehydrogenase
MSGAEEQLDVVVIGFGGAGACAAIEAADAGARVLALERFEAGGATRRSGGVVYLGGGSTAQRETGFSDSPEQMFRYLERETAGSVPGPVLERFCEESLAQLGWLEGHGLDFPSRFFAGKATQPPDGYGVYFSGNERQLEGAGAAPRGHLPAGRGMAGGVLFGALREAALRRGVELRERSRVDRLLLEQGRVVGVEVVELSASRPLRALHRGLAVASVALRQLGGVALARLERRGRRYQVRARGGVVIAAGGFVFNLEMMRRYAPGYARSMPLGTAGDDGAGIRLGVSVGAALEAMDSCAAWRFICPPSAFARGLLVNTRGERFCDESLYGATLARQIVAQPGGAAYLVVDAAIARQAVSEVNQERLRDHPLGELLGGKRAPLMFSKLNTLVTG